MKEIIIIPHIGIGQLKLGMTSEPVVSYLQVFSQWKLSDFRTRQFAEDCEIRLR